MVWFYEALQSRSDVGSDIGCDGGPVWVCFCCVDPDLKSIVSNSGGDARIVNHYVYRRKFTPDVRSPAGAHGLDWIADFSLGRNFGIG